MTGDNFIIVRKEFLDALDTEQKDRWVKVRANLEQYGISVMIGMKKVPGKLENSYSETMQFILAKNSIMLIQTFAQTSVSILESLEKFLDMHFIEVY